ncbi:MAG: hypothetical protein IJM75_04290 [Ruminococcus sp.]|nr:hypothetical protein [Ruminococcus sp.]
MKKTKIIMLFTTALLALSLASCGKEAEQSVNYEQPVRTLARTMLEYDEQGYLACFTSAASQSYQSSKDFNEEFIRFLYPESSSGQKLTVSIVSHEELDEKAIETLEKDYVKTFKRRVDITKAEKLSVRFKLYQKNLKRTDLKDITVVRVNNTWYIYGKVIDDFDFVSDAAVFSDIIKSATGSKDDE